MNQLLSIHPSTYTTDEEIRNNLTCKLFAALENLLEQESRQLDMEMCGMWGSYPRHFPNWDKAWEQARKVVEDAEKMLPEEKPLLTNKQINDYSKLHNALQHKCSTYKRILSSLQEYLKVESFDLLFDTISQLVANKNNNEKELIIIGGKNE